MAIGPVNRVQSWEIEAEAGMWRLGEASVYTVLCVEIFDLELLKFDFDHLYQVLIDDKGLFAK